MTDTELVTGDIQAALDAGVAGAAPEKLDEDGRFFSVVTPRGATHHIIDLEDQLDRHRDRPRRKAGQVTVHTATAFIQYLAKHGLPETEIWADLSTSRIVAVINAHQDINDQGDAEGPAGWGDHRATLALQKTPAWLAWMGRNSQLGGQLEFAEHLENRAVDIVNPSSATMLELAQTFTANRRIGFDSSQRLSTGEIQLNYHEDIDAKAGRKGDIAIPSVFELALQPYEGSPHYKVDARLRYRIHDQRLTIGYFLDRPEDILRNAFTDVTEQIATETERQVWHGTPA